MILPPEYEPYPALRFCSNILRHVSAPILVGEQAPVLVGKGRSPRIWISVPRKDRPNVWLQVVSDSNASGAFLVEHNNFATKVYLGVMALMVVEVTGSIPEVTFLDLRPLGLDIWGDRLSLHAGGAVLSENTFSNSQSMLAFGQPG